MDVTADHPSPSAALDPDFERRFGGLGRLYGEAGAQRVFASHAVVVGLGGVGSWAAEALARSGVGALTLIDLDHLSPSNTNRQIHALTDTFGQSKVLAMRDRIGQIHPGCRVRTIEEFVTPENWPQLMGDTVDQARPVFVLDACDQMSAKVALAAWALQTGQPFVTVGAAGGKRWGHAVEVGDLEQTTHDPVLSRLRQRLRKLGHAPRQGPIGLTCVYSREPMVMPTVCEGDRLDATLNCHGYGSSVAVTATFGLCAAGHLIDRMAHAIHGRKQAISSDRRRKAEKVTL